MYLMRAAKLNSPGKRNAVVESCLNRVMKLFLLLLLPMAAPAARAQVAPSTAGGSRAVQPTTWDMSIGYSYERLHGLGFLGFSGSAAEFPYPSRPWLGGEFQVTGGFGTQQQAGQSYDVGIYRLMGGPIVALRDRTRQPFAHALVGGLLATGTSMVQSVWVPDSKQATAMAGQTILKSASAKTLSVEVGGGIDAVLNQKISLRFEGDWVRSGTDVASNSMLVMAGVVYHF